MREILGLSTNVCIGGTSGKALQDAIYRLQECLKDKNRLGAKEKGLESFIFSDEVRLCLTILKPFADVTMRADGSSCLYDVFNHQSWCFVGESAVSEESLRTDLKKFLSALPFFNPQF